MRFYQFQYRLKRPEYSTLNEWPAARAFFGLDDSYQYRSEEIKVFVSDYLDNMHPPIEEWFGAERDAVVRRLELFKAGKLQGKKSDHEIWPVDVPTTKADLLVWLNKEAV
jgi:hypothetical protein